jgi:hypothetical protein
MLILSYLLFQARVRACLNHGEGITYNERLQDSVDLHTHQLACQLNSFRLKNYSDGKSHTKHGGFWTVQLKLKLKPYLRRRAGFQETGKVLSDVSRAVVPTLSATNNTSLDDTHTVTNSKVTKDYIKVLSTLYSQPHLKCFHECVSVLLIYACDKFYGDILSSN